MNYDFLTDQENLIWNLRQEGKTYKAITEQTGLYGTLIRKILVKAENKIERHTVLKYTQHDMDKIQKLLEWHEKELFGLRDFARYQKAKLDALEKTAFYTDRPDGFHR